MVLASSNFYDVFGCLSLRTSFFELENVRRQTDQLLFQGEIDMEISCGGTTPTR
jgi:hypothetical protein